MEAICLSFPVFVCEQVGSYEALFSSPVASSSSALATLAALTPKEACRQVPPPLPCYLEGLTALICSSSSINVRGGLNNH
ncbi:hypothetical protein EV1_027916 [Malus domestica]